MRYRGADISLLMAAMLVIAAGFYVLSVDEVVFYGRHSMNYVRKISGWFKDMVGWLLVSGGAFFVRRAMSSRWW